jgi:hypothetical protein
MTLTSRLWPVAAALGVLVAACGPSSSGSAGGAGAPSAAVAAASPLPNACDVLSEAVAKKYLGPAAALTRKAQPNAHMTQCQWTDDNGQITVMVGPWDMVHTGTPDDKPVAGLGDEAYIGPGGLFVRKGGGGISVMVIVASGEFWGAAADKMEDQMADTEKKVAPDLVANL